MPIDLSHIVDSILSSLKNPDTWSVIVSILYAAILGGGSFLIKKFGVRLARNARKIDKVVVNVEALASENKESKADIERLKAEILRRDLDYARLEEAYRIQDELFDTSREQSALRESQLQREIDRQHKAAPAEGTEA